MQHIRASSLPRERAPQRHDDCAAQHVDACCDPAAYIAVVVVLFVEPPAVVIFAGGATVVKELGIVVAGHGSALADALVDAGSRRARRQRAASA